MENATKRIGMASGSTHWEKAGMTQEEWKKAVKFDSTDWGWVIMSISTWRSWTVFPGCKSR
ncbi:hypothetical protein [Megasphaera sp.]|uniref:hypothetical protein n=1 Tax=Megasphaera sp. TaxID=2023260 RepID=UPI003520E63D